MSASARSMRRCATLHPGTIGQDFTQVSACSRLKRKYIYIYVFIYILIHGLSVEAQVFCVQSGRHPLLQVLEPVFKLWNKSLQPAGRITVRRFVCQKGFYHQTAGS